MAVHKLTERPIHDRLRLVAADEPLAPTPDPTAVERAAATEAEREARASRNAAIVIQAGANLLALARIVSTRAILGLVAAGAFGLAIGTTLHPSVPAIVVMAVFDGLVFVPLVALESGLLGKLRE
jgi:hypothetical protein